MFYVALFAGLWYTFAGWRPGYSTHEIWMFPLTVALPIGLIMGDVPGAMILGSAIGMLYVGLVAPGSETPADMSLAGLIGISIGLSIDADPGTAIMIAVPFGVLGVFLNQIRRTVNAKFAHMADKYALACDEKGIARCAILHPLIMNFILKFPPAFMTVYYGAAVVEKFINMLPVWMLNGIAVAGGVLPAIGFAIIINMIGKRSIFPFFFLGYFLVQFFQVSTIAAACFGIPMAIIIVLMTKENQDEVLSQTNKLLEGSSDEDELEVG